MRVLRLEIMWVHEFFQDLQYKKISNTVQGMFRLLLSSAHMICERVISVLSFFIPRRVPAVQVDHVQIDSEGSKYFNYTNQFICNYFTYKISTYSFSKHELDLGLLCMVF